MSEVIGDVTISAGDDVLLFFEGRTYLIQARHGEQFHTHKGFIQIDDILDKRYGDQVSTNLGYSFYLFKPTIYDYSAKTSRVTQIVYLKDSALIVAYSGVGPGSRVIEAGTGSGALTIALAHYVKPEGRVYSYDVKAEFQARAMRNLVRAGVAGCVELKVGDATEGFVEKGVDAVVLDLATPWLVVPKAYEVLQGGGRIVSFSPTIDQVIKTVSALREGFMCIETIECIARRYKVKMNETRPETLMVGHTGYITNARKVFRE